MDENVLLMCLYELCVPAHEIIIWGITILCFHFRMSFFFFYLTLHTPCCCNHSCCFSHFSESCCWYFWACWCLCFRLEYLPHFWNFPKLVNNSLWQKYSLIYINYTFIFLSFAPVIKRLAVSSQTIFVTASLCGSNTTV